MKTASQWTQLSGVKLKENLSTNVWKLPYCFTFFMNILIDNLMMQFFHNPHRTMSLSKEILQ